MTDWTDGYVTDVVYTYGYYQELNPLRIKLAFLSAGLASPEVGTACELGYGQGMSISMHAAASVTAWHGTDFNPAQAAFAMELDAVSGAGAALYDEAFDEFCGRLDLPAFDYIALHGIWSWISDENRVIIVDFIRRKLKVGGVLYISYNTMPGWAAFAPMQHLMKLQNDVFGQAGHSILNRIDSSIEFVQGLMAVNPLYARANPLIAGRIEKLNGQNRNYLAHEYFNRNWNAMHFSEIADWLLPAKVEYACSAHYLDHIDTLNLTQEQQAFMKEVPDPMFRQSVRDFMVNQQFRKDYWVKGARKLSALEQVEAWREQKVLLVTQRPDVSLKVSGALGEASMSEQVYNPLLDALADHKPKTVGQLEQELKENGISFAQLTESIMILSGSSNLSLVHHDVEISKAKIRTEKLNAHLMGKSRAGNDIIYLASPVTGGGVVVGRFQQLFLLAMKQGKKKPAEWAEVAWQILAMQGQSLVKDGKTMATVEENLAELTAQANTFGEKLLPILKALQIA
jgi:SAM-dependent methyltransferase